MSYIKHDWNNQTWGKGQALVQKQLNEMEAGIASGEGGVELFTAKYNTTSYDEIVEAYNAGKMIELKNDSSSDVMFAKLTYISDYTEEGLGKIFEFTTIRHNFDPESTAESDVQIVTQFVYKKNDATVWNQCIKMIY